MYLNERLLEIDKKHKDIHGVWFYVKNNNKSKPIRKCINTVKNYKNR